MNATEVTASASFLRQRKGRSILLVGNKAQEMLVISLLLQKFDYQVSTVNAVAQALERMRTPLPSLIITDLTLPGMSGIDLYDLLRQERRTAIIPVIFLIPLSDAASERRCLDIGAAGYLSKPVQPEELYRTVQTLIESKPRTDIRIDARIAVSVDNLPINSLKSVCEIDLSEHGMFLPMEKPYPKNRRINLQIQIKNQTISAVGVVLYNYSAIEGSSKKPGLGLKFITIRPQDQELIRAFIRDAVAKDIKTALTGGTVMLKKD